MRLHNSSERTRRFELTSYRELAMATTDAYRRAPSFAALHVGTCFVRPLGALLAHSRLLQDRRERSSPEVTFHAVHAHGDQVQLLGYEDSRIDFIGSGTLRRAAVFDARTMRSPDDEGHLYTFDPIASLRVAVRVPAHGSAEVRFVDGYAEDAQGAAALIAHAFAHPVPPRLLHGSSEDASQGVSRKKSAVDAPIRQRFGSTSNAAWGSPSVFEPPARRDFLKAILARERSLRQFDIAAPENSFSADGLEVHAAPDARRPWSHVLANPLHGAVIGADGGVFSFHANSQQNALTPFALEALPTQTPGQLLAVVDLDSGERFNTTLIPWRRTDAAREVLFGLGYVRFRARYPDLDLEETLVVPPDAPLLLRTLRVRNTGATPRRLRAIAYAEMALAEAPLDSMGRIEVREHADQGVLLFRNAHNDFAKGWAFVATDLLHPAQESVRARFLGGAREVGDAYFLQHGSGDRVRRDDGRRCAAFADRLELAPGEERCVNLLIGQSDDANHALDWARRFRNAEAATLVQSTRAWWQRQLDGLRIETDRAEFDRLVNTWLPYQVLCARLWARCGPQQRSGGFGFRDQLQDVLPFSVSLPQLARRQILLHAAQQFREGDVLFWWHFSWEGRTGLGARSAASDPHLWLPYVVAHYVHATDDRAVLQEDLPFLEGRKRPRRVGGIVFAPRPSKDHATLYEHCRRALNYTLARLSPRGLPLIGGGDWNDSLDALGLHGRGESGWLGFFLHRILLDFAPIAEAQGDGDSRQRYETAAAKLRKALEKTWHHDGYTRATDDKGEALRFADCLMAAWPTLSNAVAEGHARGALERGLQALERDTRVLLLTPPFGEPASPYPGRIAQYPPGVRENGGQYSHGASWTVDAWLQLARQAAARGDDTDASHCHRRAWELWWKISPLSKTDPAYGLPPHQQPADVYDGPGYQGRGGWAWYTGAAARMLDTAHGLLGLEMREGELHVNPVPPDTPAPRLRRLTWQGREIK